MGFCHDSHGPNRMSVESRSESFIVHPGYGWDADASDCDDTIVLGGQRVERASFARHWRDEPHPEFLLEDVPFLIRALADLETCPPIVKAGISLYFDAPELLAPPTTTWEELLGGESAVLVRLGQLVFIWAKDSPVIKVVRAEQADSEEEITKDQAELTVALEIEVPSGLDAESFHVFCREFVGADGEEAAPEPPPPLKEGDRLWLPDGRGTVVGDPDSDGRFPVAVDGYSGGPVIFIAEEVRRFTDEERERERTMLTPAEAEGLFACYSGGRVDAELLNSVTPKLEAIVGKELVRVNGSRSILFVPSANTEDADWAKQVDQVHGSAQLVSGCDIAVAGNGGLLKDRHGDGQEVLLALRAAMAVGDLTSAPSPTLLGAPFDRIEAVTLDGGHWIEVMGKLQRTAPAGGPTLTFRVAQAPGGKGRKLGIGQGDIITILDSAVCGVRRKAADPTLSEPATGVEGSGVIAFLRDRASTLRSEAALWNDETNRAELLTTRAEAMDAAADQLEAIAAEERS